MKTKNLAIRLLLLLSVLVFSPCTYGQKILESLEKINFKKIEESAKCLTKRKITEYSKESLKVQPVFLVTTRVDFDDRSNYTVYDLLNNLIFVQNNIPTSYVYTDSLKFASRVYKKEVSKIYNQELAKQSFSLEMIDTIAPTFVMELYFHSFESSPTVYLCYKDDSITILKNNKEGVFEILPLSNVIDWRCFNPEMRVTKRK